MDEFDLSVLLWTPGSDLSTGSPGAKFEAVFARKGNDTIYAYDPGVSNPNQNIDFLFGDIFDNSEEEYEIILNIQATPQGGNPLLILERDIPSVGADRFVLGDEIQPYYTSSSPDTLGTTNFLGLNEFAVIYDFDKEQDTIQLNGKRKDYRLVEVNGLKVEGVDQPFYGEAIFSVQQGLPDLVAFVISKPEVDLDLKDKYFRFVGEKPQQKPAKRRIGQLGTTGIDLSLDAATDPSGNLYLAGYTSGPLQGTNQGLADAWVAKFDNKGNKLLGKQIGTPGGDSAYATATDNDGNFYLAGFTTGDLFSSKQSQSQDAWVAKYDSNGNLLWGKQFGANLTGGFSNPAFGLEVDEEGNVYLSGLGIKENTRTDIFNFPVQDDSWVAKFDSNGNQQWFTEIKDPSASFPFSETPFFDESYDLAIDKDGNTYLTGWTQGLVKESDPSRQLLKYDAWLAKVNPDGQVQWVQQFGSQNEGLEFSWAVDTDSQGNIYTTGWTTGDLAAENNKSYDIWLSKFSPDGTQLWTKQFGSQGDDGMFASDMEIDSQDNIFLTGYTNDRFGKGQKDGSYNAWVGKFDTEGNNNWIQQFGSKKNLDYGIGLATHNNDKLYVTGITEAFLGNNNTGANGAAVDAWVAELNPKNGRLRKFTNGGSTATANDITSIDNPTPISTVDVSNKIVTEEKLPSGDNIINPAQGINTPGSSTVDYGQIISGLGSIFDPNSQNTFPTALASAVNSSSITI
ncbi:SBBP repeat-containing protein [Fischerella sp. PCC 9605]|uniref:SBBP repeat-containing protein n=1 Tax=Fischerella sp. PCC 9605 TaxID=1173024 RepID=UPI0004BC4509|nr:SBBP repeat-containing protein [Fischerella sp. PCC 9605]